MSTLREQALEAAAQTPNGLLIGGEWVGPRSGRMFPVEDPATEDVVAEASDATPEDAIAALDAAHAAQRDWAMWPARERAELLRRAFDLIAADAERFALLISLETGKPLAEAKGEVAYGNEYMRWFSEEACRVRGSYAEAPMRAARILTLRQPVGPALAITPWNFPLAMLTRKVAPAFAAGCTVLVKPAGQTPLTALLFADRLLAAGVPDGVLSVLTTSSSSELVRALTSDPRLRKLSFTGSTEVGRVLLEQAAQNVIRTSMELGGNAPFIVLDDADLERAVEAAVVAKLRNGGESCVAANRFYVQQTIAAEFAERFAARVKSLHLGSPFNGGEVGPLIDSAACTRVGELVADARRAGARVATGGDAVDGPGWFYEPTVMTDVAPPARLLAEEIFGPVAPITTFDAPAEAVERANATPFGLAAYVFTSDTERAFDMIDSLDSGMVALNRGLVSEVAAPFGGVKASGLGREGGAEGIDEYLELKYVAMDGRPGAVTQSWGAAA